MKKKLRVMPLKDATYFEHDQLLKKIVNNTDPSGDAPGLQKNGLVSPRFLRALGSLREQLPVLGLAILPFVLFRSHIFRDAIWIGNSDRLNSHLKVLSSHVNGLATGRLSAWNDHEMLGYDTFVLNRHDYILFLNVLGDVCSKVIQPLIIPHPWVQPAV